LLEARNVQDECEGEGDEQFNDLRDKINEVDESVTELENKGQENTYLVPPTENKKGGDEEEEDEDEEEDYQFENNSCDICGQYYKYSSDLYRHIRKNHAVVEQKNYECDIMGCDKRLKWSKPRFAKRLCQSHKMAKAKVAACEECQKSFTYKYTYERHKNEQHANPPNRYQCMLCPLQVKRKSYLLSHLEMVHRYIRPKCIKKYQPKKRKKLVKCLQFTSPHTVYICANQE
jgi:uncharacterized Zn-finger protein